MDVPARTLWHLAALSLAAVLGHALLAPAPARAQAEALQELCYGGCPAPPGDDWGAADAVDQCLPGFREDDGALTIWGCYGHTRAGFTRFGDEMVSCTGGKVQTAEGCMFDVAGGNGGTCGNPVDPAGGAKILTVTDYRGEGERGLTLTRHYRHGIRRFTGRLAYSRFGMGWRSNFDAGIHFVLYHPTGIPYRAHVVMPDGREIYFQNYAGTLYPTSLAEGGGWREYGRETITRVGLDFEVRDADDTVLVFTPMQVGTSSVHIGKLTQVRYRGGYTVNLAYDSDLNNTTVTDSFGRTLTFAYDASGRATQATLPDARVIKFEYQSTVDWAAAAGKPGLVVPVYINAVLTNVIYPDETPGDTDNPRLVYHYENANYPFAITGITDERGIRLSTYDYDANGRAIETRWAGNFDRYTFAYDYANRTTTVTNALGKQAIFRYHLLNGERRLTQIDGQASTYCPAAASSYAYDGFGFLNQITDEEGRVTRWVNDARGRPTSITRGYGTASAVTTTFTWDATRNLPTEMVEPGLTTTYSWTMATGQLASLTQTDTTSHTTPYSTNGQTRTWAFTYGAGGRLATVDGPLAGSGDTVTYAYDGNGFLTSVTNEVGHVTTFSNHNGRGQPQTMTDANGVVTTFTYDPRGRLLTTTVNPGAGQAVTAFAYNAAGDITRVTRPDGSYLDYTYDDARRLTAVQDNLLNRIEYDRDGLGGITATRVKDPGGAIVRVQTQTFDELGRLIRMIGASSQTTALAYDKVGNLTAVTDPRSGVYGYAYDPLNRLIRETNESAGEVNLTLDGRDQVTAYSDPRSLATTYVRNGFGEAIQEVSPDRGTITFTLNALGLPTAITDGRGVVENRTYDHAGRLLTRSFPAAPAETVTVTWDGTAGGNFGIGRITRLESQSAAIRWTWDAFGRRTAEEVTLGAHSYTVSYAYDLAGNIAAITYPSGREVAYARDAAGRISGVTTRAGPAAPWVTVASSFFWRPFGPVQGFTHGNGLATWRTFTQDGDLDVLMVEDGATDLIRRSHTRTDGLNITNIWDDVVPARSQSFWYNARNQLQNADGPWGALIYYYDLVGNRTYEIETPPGGGAAVTRVHTYPSTSNRIAAVRLDTAAGTPVRSFTHDGAGNIVQDVRAGTGTYAYAMNQRGRLAAASLGATPVGAYVYDGLERLAIRTTSNVAPAGTTHFAYGLAGQLLVEADGATGAVRREYIWLDAMPLAIVADVDTAPRLLHVHADHLDRPIMLTDGAKANVWEAVYRPFGEVHALTGAETQTLRFPGQYFLFETGLAHNWHRTYDPTIGRYLQPDPLGFADGPSVYRYGLNSPQMATDPEGLQVLGGVLGQNVTPWEGGGRGGGGGGRLILFPGSFLAWEAWKQFLNWCMSGGDSRRGDPCEGLRRMLREHEEKLQEFTRDPHSLDNRGLLGQGRDQQIIEGRIRRLRGQIENFRRQLEECERRNRRQ